MKESPGMIRTVAVPCLSGDLENFRFLLECWSYPEFFPSAEIQGRTRTLMVVLNNADSETCARFREVADDFPTLKEVFPQVEVHSAGLEGDRDLYVKDCNEAVGKYGNKAGPNFLFFATLDAAARHGGFTFQCEVDCFPMRRHWLDELDRHASGHPEAWVIGSYYAGAYPIEDNIRFHINGNALYHVGDSKFCAFLENVWKKRLFKFVDIHPNLAYDCWWSIELSRASAHLQNNSWKYALAHSHRFVGRPIILNLLHRQTLPEDLEIATQLEDASGDRHVMIHAHFVRHMVRDYLRCPQNPGEFLTFLRNQADIDIPEEISGTSGTELPLTGGIGERLSLQGITYVSSFFSDEYSDVTLCIQMRKGNGRLAVAMLRFQMCNGDYLLEFRPQDNPEILVNDRFEILSDNWGAYVRMYIHELWNLPAADLSIRPDAGVDLDQVLTILVENWDKLRTEVFDMGTVIDARIPSIFPRWCFESDEN